jgi:hypothetical protein
LIADEVCGGAEAYHLRKVFAKFGISSRAGLAVLLRTAGHSAAEPGLAPASSVLHIPRQPCGRPPEPGPGYAGLGRSFRPDIWLGNTGWHEMPC